MVGGRHVGNVFIGQFFLEGETPDIEFFRNQARRYGFDEGEYLQALERVPRFSQETVDAGMRFYSRLSELISSLSYSSIQQSRLIAERERNGWTGGPDRYEFDFRVVYPDSSIHWLNVKGQVIERDPDGRGTLVRGCLIDITERKLIEENLKSLIAEQGKGGAKKLRTTRKKLRTTNSSLLFLNRRDSMFNN